MTRISKLIPEAQKILAEYQNRITIRQLYYRLVSANIIPNSLTGYNGLIQRMIVARRDGRIPFSVFYDATRRAVEGEAPDPEIMDHKEMFNNNREIVEDAENIAINQLKNTPYKYDLPFWYLQPSYVEVWIEKEALASIVSPIAKKYGLTFIACKGYPSLSLLYDSTSRFNAVPEDKVSKILYFGDYDCRGVNIEQNIERNLSDDFGIDVEVTRYALTKDQIAEYQLPAQPAKKTDTMVKGWLETNGDVAWELDALPPDKLSTIVKNAILANNIRVQDLAANSYLAWTLFNRLHLAGKHPLIRFLKLELWFVREVYALEQRISGGLLWQRFTERIAILRFLTHFSTTYL